MVFQPSSIPLWAAIAALAGVAQVVVLIVTARFVWRYLQETERLRIAAQQQVGAASDQLEAQIRPALVVHVRPAPYSLELVNVGKGPALDLVLSPAQRGSAGAFETSDQEAFDDDIAFLEVSGRNMTGVRTQPVAGHGGPTLAGRSLQCQYKSLSGRTYWTVVDFDPPTGNSVIDTRFYQEPIFEQ